MEADIAQLTKGINIMVYFEIYFLLHSFENLPNQ